MSQDSTPLIRGQQTPYRESSSSIPTDLDNFYSGTIPPPHRLSPYPNSQPLDISSGLLTSVPVHTSSGLSNMNAPQTYMDLDSQPNPVTHSNAWLEKPQRSNRKSKLIVISSVIGLIVVIAVAVGVGVGVSLSNKKSSGNSSSLTSSSPTGVVNQTNPNDPSTFVKDARLKHSLYGLAYSPAGSIYPTCGATLPQVIEDVQLISQLTSRVRLYGADCNVSALVLEAIVQTKVNMSIFLGNYVTPGDPTAYTRQKTAIQNAITTYGTSHISGITVGNEFMLNYMTANGIQNASSAAADVGAQLLISNITDTKSALQQMNVDLPVGTSDAGSYFNPEVLAAVDYGMANVHPWFGNVSIDQAAQWTWQFFQDNDVSLAQTVSPSPQMYIAETGWPSNSSDVSNESNGPSMATEPNLQYFLNTFVCQANANGTNYFYFEYFDEQWKDIQYGGVEGHWGLFYQNKTLKSITIPDCPI